MKTNILKITALCASIALASSANAQTIGFQASETIGNPTSDIIMTVNDASGLHGISGNSEFTALSVKIDVTNTGGNAFGIAAMGSINPIISNDVYAETTRDGSNAIAIANVTNVTLQGGITLSAKATTGNAYAFSNVAVNLHSNGGTHTLIGGVSAADFRIHSGKYIWGSHSDYVNFNFGTGGRIDAGVEIEFMNKLVVSNGTFQTYGHLYFHASDISQILFQTKSLAIGSSAKFTIILDEGFEAFEDDEMSIRSGGPITLGFFDVTNLSIVLSSTGESLSYGEDFIVSMGGVITFLTDVSVVAIPEPSTYAMIFGALALGLAVYRRRK